MVKQKKVPAAKGDDAEQMVMEYLRKQNRPYSATVTKTVAQKVLNSLVEKNEINCKPYGKQYVYYIKQDQLESPSSEELLTMDAEIEDLKKEINEFKEKNRRLQSEFNGLNSSLTNKQIDERIEIVKEENQKYGERLQVLQSGTIQISDEEKKQIDEGYEKNRKLWRQRKRMFYDMFNLILDYTEKKKTDFMEELDIELDPVEIDEDPLKDL
ncbi:15408_t:CDS:2 [Entrophospora sp. SA101]|nr:15408_t:CDS:2 [Entrophospora sp. SA101]